MEEPPESWPPDPPPILPLFALPDVWLYPAIILPLHIFEERYKAMIEDHLDGQGRIVLGTVQAGHEGELDGAPPVYPIGGLGEIGRHERVEGGRFNLLLIGLKRVRIRETKSDRAYRQVVVDAADEIPIDPRLEPDYRNRLVAAILERTEGQTAFPADASISRLTDLLTLRIELPHSVLNELFSTLDEEQRARRVLEEHASR